MDKRPLTANELRKLAEAVDGIRDEMAYVVWTGDGPQVKTKVDRGDEIIVECETKSAVKDRPTFNSIVLDPPMVDQHGVPVTELKRQYDAMFWSEAAVEKFLIPYYVRFSTPHEVASIRKAFNHPTVYAMIHPPLSDISVMTAIRTAGQGVEVLRLKEFESLL